MTIQDLQVSSSTSTESRTSNGRLSAFLRSWVAAYVRSYEPMVGSTTVDVSPLLRFAPLR